MCTLPRGDQGEVVDDEGLLRPLRGGPVDGGIHYGGNAATFMNVGEAMGRPLDFLCQELNREINTIGSKANDAGIAQRIVRAKTELEKIREQVQNIQ